MRPAAIRTRIFLGGLLGCVSEAAVSRNGVLGERRRLVKKKVSLLSLWQLRQIVKPVDETKDRDSFQVLESILNDGASVCGEIVSPSSRGTAISGCAAKQ